MALHTQPGRPQWEMIPQEDWTDVQRRAAETNGWDTPGNRESFKGLAYTAAGLALLTRKHWALKATGVGLVTYGRWKDIKDGKVAEATETKSPKGEAIDAAIDKGFIAGAIATSIKTASTTAQELIGVGAQQGANLVLSLYAKAEGIEIHPRLPGKVAVFGFSGAFILHSAGDTLNAAGLEPAAETAHKAGRVLNGASVALGAFGTIHDFVIPIANTAVGTSDSPVVTEAAIDTAAHQVALAEHPPAP